MADDILDLPVLGRAGLSAAPADAVEEVRTRVHWVSPSGGGDGAARELVELVLRAQGQWDPLVAAFADAQAARPAAANSRTIRSPTTCRCSRPSWPCWLASPSARPGSSTSC